MQIPEPRLNKRLYLIKRDFCYLCKRVVYAVSFEVLAADIARENISSESDEFLPFPDLVLLAY